jgi:hypothetical protein
MNSIVIGYKKYIKSYCSYYNNSSNKIYINANDLTHQSRIYKNYNIQPESLDHVQVDFVLQTHNLIRYIIKELDLMLKVGGIFEINIFNNKSHSIFYRSRDHVKYEFSISTNGRYVLEVSECQGNNGVLNLRYKKIKNTLSINDTIEKWSFGIITNGKKNASVLNLISSIVAQKIPFFEIIICGPFNESVLSEKYNVKVLDDTVLNNDLRIPTQLKKNKIIENAIYDNLVIFHDRFKLPSYWFNNMKIYGNYFDYLILRTIDENGYRFAVDWMSFDDQISNQISNKNKLMNYKEWNRQVIIQGGVIVGKKELIMKHKLDESLFWEELEDIHFSKLANLYGSFFYLDTNNCFISESVNHKPLNKKSGLSTLKHNLSWIYNLFKTYLKFNYLLWDFYKKNK